MAVVEIEFIEDEYELEYFYQIITPTQIAETLYLNTLSLLIISEVNGTSAKSYTEGMITYYSSLTDPLETGASIERKIQIDKGTYNEFCIRAVAGQLNIIPKDPSTSSSEIIIIHKNIINDSLNENEDRILSPLISVEYNGLMSITKATLVHFSTETLRALIQVQDDGVLIAQDIKLCPSGTASLEDKQSSFIHQSPYIQLFRGRAELDQIEIYPTQFSNCASIHILHNQYMKELNVISSVQMNEDPQENEIILKDSVITGIIREQGIGEAIECDGMKLTIIGGSYTWTKQEVVQVEEPASQLIQLNGYDMEEKEIQSRIDNMEKLDRYNNMKNKNKNRKRLNINNNLRNEEGAEPPHLELEPLVPSCTWNNAYIRHTNSYIRIQGGALFQHLGNGVLSIVNSQMLIDSEVQFRDNRNGNEREAGTEYRRNILCGKRSSIEGSYITFQEDGVQEKSLWILKTDEDTNVGNNGQESSSCQLLGEIKDVDSSLFVPVLTQVEWNESKDEYGSDIKLYGRHFVKCSFIRYEVCENIKYKDESGATTEEKFNNWNSHCQRGLLENGTEWGSEQSATVQTRYKIVRKWKELMVLLYFGEEKTTESFVLKSWKNNIGVIIASAFGALFLVGIAATLLGVVIYCAKKKKDEKNRMDQIEDIEMNVEDQDGNEYEHLIMS
ncbi:MAG: hypothetical protein EZS28_029763 [Streblomastix strix]|uniref:Uncharacterized protein n=1 Tax=Streblomastix strix TaxID=222440 RepID=A0A5J4UX30_9EUKA|nr:MAG: hypothetical protein EZS28_029763 [Streblomastix strix]